MNIFTKKRAFVFAFLSAASQTTFGEDLHGPGGRGPKGWADNDWNWYHGPSAQSSAQGDRDMNHNACPAELTSGPPKFTLPFQQMLPMHFQNDNYDQHWQHMCPRDRDAGVLYHPVPENRGCCTWRATATNVNGNWACCPCGASCNGNVPAMGAQWTQGQAWGALPAATVTVTSSQFYPTPYTTRNPNGGLYTVYPNQPQPGQTFPPQQYGGQPGYGTFAGGVYPPGPTYPPQYVTGTKVVPVSVCQYVNNNGKQSCTTIKTTAVLCSVQNGNQKCRTSTGPVMQTVNAAPTGLAGRGLLGAAIAGLAAVGAAVI
ncbi:hypothetical protein EJ08DRAFT_736832 [Tothia fuscella]|uniref:Uncharacterized protein n=1 Tax=Tothia fuscella TaxID=1048955 RepID=A0A9P4NKP2_9PEZI|nr:hypothetical protein EJ08DRAFT_736832 [Tothia fuscella]